MSSYSSYRQHKSSTSSSTSTSSRASYGGGSANWGGSSGTPPSTPMIRVTSPVPDAVAVIDIWDPQVPEPDAAIDQDDASHGYTSPKSYSFRYREEGKESASSGRKTFTESSMQADFCGEGSEPNVSPASSSPASPASPLETSKVSVGVGINDLLVGAGLTSLASERSLSDDDGLRTAGESEDSVSDVEESSQISAVTQVPQTQLEGADVTAASTAVGDRVDQDRPLPSKSKTGRSDLMRSVSMTHDQGFRSEAPSSGRNTARQAKNRRHSSMESSSYRTFEALQEDKSTPVNEAPPSESATSPGQYGTGQETEPIEPGTLSLVVEDHQAGSETIGEDVEEEEDDDQDEAEEKGLDVFDRLPSMKEDVELMEAANLFVTQLLHLAQDEALKRGLANKVEQKAKMSLDLQHVAGPKGVKRNPWYRRLRALVLRTLTCTCVPSHPNIQSPLST